jgi:hypothetical protein
MTEQERESIISYLDKKRVVCSFDEDGEFCHNNLHSMFDRHQYEGGSNSLANASIRKVSEEGEEGNRELWEFVFESDDDGGPFGKRGDKVLMVFENA